MKKLLISGVLLISTSSTFANITNCLSLVGEYSRINGPLLKISTEFNSDLLKITEGSYSQNLHINDKWNQLNEGGTYSATCSDKGVLNVIYYSGDESTSIQYIKIPNNLIKNEGNKRTIFNQKK